MSEWSLTYRQALVVEQTESLPHIIIPSAAPLRTRGDLIHFDAIGVTYKGASKPLLDNVTFTVSQGSRVAFLGAVSILYHSQITSLSNAMFYAERRGYVGGEDSMIADAHDVP
jgi:ATPase subunit of ABC transporter with duplicated ATPase domains